MEAPLNEALLFDGERPSDVRSAAGANALALEVSGFSFAYPAVGDAPAQAVLNGLDWSVQAGEFVVLTGATGGGKTTLLRSAKPEIAPTGERAGEIRVFGRNVNDLSALESAELIGYVAQNPDNQIVCDTVWHEMAFGLENIGLPQDEMRRRIAEIAHFFGIEPWFRRQCDSLSGGQKQLLNVAAVLALRPRLLLLDEPTSQLDPVAEKDFLHALFRVNRELGLTVVVVTHQPEPMLAYATRCVWLHESVMHDVDMAHSLEMPELPANAFAIGAPVATMDDVWARYARTDDFVLRGCDFTLNAGSLHALVGGNGSGKSTVLKVIAGNLKHERGAVRNAAAKRFAFLPQNPKTLFVCDTVDEELREWQKGAGYSDGRIADLMARFHLDGLGARHPYDLSGGQQQLLALCKVMLPDPDLLLLDEPTKGLDVATKISVAHALRSFAASGRTVLFVTHDLAFVNCVVSTASMLFDGEMACTQPAGEFFRENLFFKPIADGFVDAWINGLYDFGDRDGACDAQGGEAGATGNAVVRDAGERAGE